jgi:Flp pilus assembly pilin Flp
MRLPKLGTVRAGEKGQSMVEYVMIVVLVVVVALVAFKMFGTTVKEKMNEATNTIKSTK